MMTIRRSRERGHFNHGWLESFHTFSFAEYHDAQFMSFGPLRVLNEDYIKEGQGFGMHPHRDMEIITFVVSGQLEHKDSMGNGTVILPGEVQYMCAGTGIRHSEYNPSSKDATHLLQIWIMPPQNNLAPSYQQKSFKTQLESGELVLLMAPAGHDLEKNHSGALPIYQDIKLYGRQNKQADKWLMKLNPFRHYFIQVIKGGLNGKNITAKAGDALMIKAQDSLEIDIAANSEFLFFDMV